MYCSNCGKEIDNCKVCPYCGTPNNANLSQSELAKQFVAPAVNKVTNQVKSFQAKGTSGLTSLLKICCWIRVIIYAVAGGFIGEFIEKLIPKSSDGEFITAGIILGIIFGIIAVVKDMIFANIADNVNVIANNTAENNKTMVLLNNNINKKMEQ